MLPDADPRSSGCLRSLVMEDARSATLQSWDKHYCVRDDNFCVLECNEAANRD